MIVVLYWCVKYSFPTGLATWDSSTGLILLFRLFSAYFKTIFYWYKCCRFWKPWLRRDQPCTYLGNRLSMSGDIPQTVCGLRPWEWVAVDHLWVPAQSCTRELFKEYLQTYWTDFQDKYMPDLVSLRAFRIIMTYISTKWSKNRSSIGKIILSSLYCCSKRVNWLESWTVYAM